MRRWLVLSLGVGIVVVALYVLAHLRGAPPSVDEIDDASRARLERVLREAEER